MQKKPLTFAILMVQDTRGQDSPSSQMDLMVLCKSGQQDSINCHGGLRGSDSHVFQRSLNHGCSYGLSKYRSILRKSENTVA